MSANGATQNPATRDSVVEPSSSADEQTFPALLLRNASGPHAHEAFIREKHLGIWSTHSWADSWREVVELAHGLAELGFVAGDKLCVVGDNRPRLYWAMLAAQSLQGVPVPLYQDSIEREMQYIVDHADARFAVVEDQEQADKLLAVRDACPKLEYIIYSDSRGLQGYRQERLLSMSRVQQLGREHHKTSEGFLRGKIAELQADDLAVICYTSGTTGKPKGVMLSHRNFLETSANIMRLEGLKPQESVLAYLPMAWVGDFFLSVALALVGRFIVHCPESGATVMHDMREAGPTYFFAPPRIWENMLTTVMIRMEDAARFKRGMFRRAIALAEKLQQKRRLGEIPSFGERLAWHWYNFWILAPLRDNLGLSKLRVAYTAGEAIGPELFDFFRGLGVNLKQLYGMTEASVFVSLQRDDDVLADSVGPPVPWVEVRISEKEANEGEVLFKGVGVFKGYYKNKEATKEAFDEGWLRSGDAGAIDRESGHLKILDRLKDVSKLEDGTLFAPKYVENKLKFSPYIKEVVSVGQGKPYVTAMLNIDLEAVGNWAEKQGLAYTGYADLSQKPQVYDLVAQDVQRVNAELGKDPAFDKLQIKRFLILHKELDPDDEEITRTRKVRRRFVAEKYADLIEGLYTDAERIDTRVEVTFEDGRKAKIEAQLAVHRL